MAPQNTSDCCRLQNGELQYAEHRHNDDLGGIDPLFDLDAGFGDDEEYEVRRCAFCMLYREAQNCYRVC